MSAAAQHWHLKMTFRAFDEQGKVEDQGTFEEYWAAPNKSKRVLSSSAVHKTDYRTDKGVFQIGDRGPVPATIAKTLQAVLHSWPWSQGSLVCSVAPPLQFTCSHPILYLDKPLPSDFDGTVEGKTILTAHVESIEPLTANDAAQFEPPPDAVPVEIHVVTVKAAPPGNSETPSHFEVSAGTAESLVATRTQPVYPPIARAARVQGTVVLKGIIGKDGRVESLEVISGPAMLQQAALDAVMSWTYRPYLLNGSPAEFETTINVVFSLTK